jgi:protein involved in polysaccharide export with SLBB domain
MRLIALFLGLFLTTAGLRAADGNSGTSTNAPSAAVDVLDDTLKLNTGVRVTYRVKEDKDLAKALIVTDTGEIDVPYLGRVRAAGKTCKELAAEIKQLLESDEHGLYHRATVVISVDSVSVFNLKEVLVQGQVGRPGPVTIPPGGESLFTLSKAIYAAGGITPFGRANKVKVIRQADPGSTASAQTFDRKERPEGERHRAQAGRHHHRGPHLHPLLKRSATNPISNELRISLPD